MNNPENNFESAPNSEQEPKNTQEIIDSLRLETQAVSPERREKFAALVRECHAAFLSLYGQYIEDPLTDQEMADRFILTNQETFEKFNDEFTKPDVEYNYSPDKGFLVTHNQDGIKFVIGYLPEVYNSLSQEGRKTLAEKHGDEEKAKEAVDKTFQKLFILHEMAHLYKSDDIDEVLFYWLSECGAYFYAHNILNKMEPEKSGITYLPKPGNYYQGLIKKYNNKIHQLYFSFDMNLSPVDQKELLLNLHVEFNDVGDYEKVFGQKLQVRYRNQEKG